MTTKALSRMTPEELVAHRRARRMDTLTKQLKFFANEPEQFRAILNKIEEINQSPTATRVCPHCHLEKLVVKDFGYTTKRGEVVAQPWCRECRNSKDSHPSKYGL